ncbi:hypothetical protein ACQPXT_13125 [Streptomyces sp. CA-100214]
MPKPRPPLARGQVPGAREGQEREAVKDLTGRHRVRAVRDEDQHGPAHELRQVDHSAPAQEPGVEEHRPAVGTVGEQHVFRLKVPVRKRRADRAGQRHPQPVKPGHARADQLDDRGPGLGVAPFGAEVVDVRGCRAGELPQERPRDAALADDPARIQATRGARPVQRAQLGEGLFHQLVCPLGHGEEEVRECRAGDGLGEDDAVPYAGDRADLRPGGAGQNPKLCGLADEEPVRPLLVLLLFLERGGPRSARTAQ